MLDKKTSLAWKLKQLELCVNISEIFFYTITIQERYSQFWNQRIKNVLNVPPTMCPHPIQLPLNKKNKKWWYFHLKLIKLHAPTSNNRAGNRSATNNCMCWDLTSLLNLFNDSLPIWMMPEKEGWSWIMDPPTMLVSLPRGSTRGHHTFCLCSLLALRIWLSSWRITVLTHFK